MNCDLNIDDKESIQRDVNLIKAALDDDHDDGPSDELITESVVDIDVDQEKNSRLALWSDGSSMLNTVPVSLDVTKIQHGDNVAIVNLCLKYLNDLQKLTSLCHLKLTEVMKNIELQEVVLQESLDECFKTSDNRVQKRSRSICTFATPYFRDAQKLTAPANEDAIQKRKNKDVDVYLQFPRPWTSVEYNLLLKAIKSTIKRNELDSLTARREYYFEKLEDCDFADERKGIKNKIKTVEEEIDELKKRPHPENFPVDQKFDWMRISAHFPDMLRNHEECELMWRNYLHPAINKKKWTEEEDNKLIEIARIHQFRDWESIAEKMTLSKRTAIQCFERYQSHLNPNRLKSAWTSEDDEELRTIIEGCRNGDYIPWHQVTYYIGGRTRLQIVSRWQRSLNPRRKRGCWSEQEDVVLLAAVEKFGNNWTKMSEFLPGRSNLSCRERYTNCLLSGIRSGNWTKEEDQLLVNCVRKYGMGKWTKVATHLTGRTDAMVLSRVNTVKKFCSYVFDGPPLDDPRELSIPYIPTHQRKSKLDKKKEFFAHADEKILYSLMKVKGFKTLEEAQNYREKMKSSSKIFLEISKQILERPANTISDVSIKQEVIETQQEFLAAAVTCHRTEEFTIDEELNSLLKPFLPSDCRYNTMDFVFKQKSVKEELEYETVRHLLGGAMQCKNVIRTYDVTDDSSSDFDSDYSAEISSVFDQCVIPKYMSSEVPIFPPNRATSVAFKQLLANRRIMDSLTLCLKGSNCIATLSCIVNCEKDEILQCSLCQSNIVSTTFNKHDENSIRQLSNELLLLSNGSHEESMEICQCKALNEMKNNYHLLRKRFLSLFFWPAILTLTSLTDDKKKLLTESKPTVTNCTDLFAWKRSYLRARRRKNPWLRKSLKTVSGTPPTSVGRKATKKNVNKKSKIDTDTSDICLRRSARLKERETGDHLQVP